MSTIRTPVGPQPPRVYWRRRILVLLGLVAVIAVVVLIIVRPGASEGAQPDPDGASGSPVVATDDPSATTLPTEEAAVDGAPCAPEHIVVEPVTDATSYGAGELPELSVTITNTGPNVCVLNAGTAAQVFTITSGSDVYWTSSDCQVDPIDADVSLTPNEPLSSAAPIVWDRTRSDPETCDDDAREPVPAGGASYHLSVSVDGFDSSMTKQMLLY
ncbi:hypothetical protein [Agromyces sp. SYSU T00194]|uniref:hypothetical protein n=1 Tax=Agromyces chitinivorans TaxID=3158560 RepID=UPI003394662D